MNKKVSSSLLDSVYIASPCNADWNSMDGDERVRFCGSCTKNVYNLSELSRKQAEEFLQVNGVSKCIRLYQRSDGTIITDDCPVGLRKIRDGARAFARRVATFLGLCLTITSAWARDGASTSPAPIEMVKPKPATPVCATTTAGIPFMGKMRALPADTLPPFGVLTSGEGALSDEIFQQTHQGKEVIYLREQDVTVGTKTNGKYSASASASELSSQLTAEEVFAKAKVYARSGKLLTADALYRITLKYFEQYPRGYGLDFKENVANRYAELLGKLDQPEQATHILNKYGRDYNQ